MAKNTEAVAHATAPESKKLVFAGARQLMTRPGTQKEANDRKLVIIVAQAHNISPFGVNVLGNQPYVNNLGRKEKLEQYDPHATFEFNWVQRALNDTDKAICEARLVDKQGKPLTPWIVGECSPVSMKMSTLAGYQNHMAQTRAENRCIQHLYGLRMHKEMLENVARLLSVGQIDERTASRAIEAGRVSAEEINHKSSVQPSTQQELPTIQLDGDQAFEIAKKKIKASRNSGDLIEVSKKIAKSKLYNAEQKKELEALINAQVDSIDNTP
jgi:hypothetical protein